MWIEALNSAQEAYFEKKDTFIKDGHSVRPKRELGEVAPVWIPDERVTNCQSCDVSP